MKPRLARKILAVGVAVLLSACGGGGDGADATPYNAAAAYQNLMTTAHHWSLSGTDTIGLDWAFELGTTPLAAGTFAPTGAAAGRLAVTITGSAAGETQSGTSTYYFDAASPAKDLLGIEMPDGSCGIAALFNPPSSAATVGSSGSLARVTVRASCAAGAATLGVVDYRWSVTRDGALTLFCLVSDDDAGASESDCVELGTDGTLGAHARVTLTAPGYRLVVKNY